MATAARARAEEFTWGHYAVRLAALLDEWTREERTTPHS
jgi:hypothetical protein